MIDLRTIRNIALDRISFLDQQYQRRCDVNDAHSAADCMVRMNETGHMLYCLSQKTMQEGERGKITTEETIIAFAKIAWPQVTEKTRLVQVQVRYSEMGLVFVRAPDGRGNVTQPYILESIDAETVDMFFVGDVAIGYGEKTDTVVYGVRE